MVQNVPHMVNNTDVWFEQAMETMILGQCDVIVAQFFASFPNFALLVGRVGGWVAVDHSFPCLRGGCPSQFTNRA
jgi:hypothetical protein